MATLIPTRISIKGRITKFKNHIAEVNSLEFISSKDVDELSLRLERFRNMFTQFDEIQTQIEIATTSDMQSEIDVREEMENDFISLIATAQKIIDKNAERSDFASVKSEGSTSCDHEKNCNGLNFRLPVIKIASFDGSYFKWLEFRDTFDSLIHNSDNIKPIHKFHYLNSYLEGEAAQVISNLEVSNNNYEEAWRLLCERYNNKKQLISNHLNSLFNLQPIGRESAKSLRYLVDHVSKNLRALNTLGQPTDKWDTLLIHMVASKLDSNTTLKWEEFKNNSFKNDDLPSLADFNDFLKGRADVLESIQRNKSEKSSASNNNKRESFTSPHNKHEKSSTKCFAISASPAASASASPPACVFCSGGHRIYDCSSFLSLPIEDRISGASRLRLCLNCLRTGHTSHRCRVAPCHICRKRHNRLLHREAPQATSAPVDAPAPRAEPGLSSHMTVSQSTQVLLPTALIDVYSPVDNSYITMRAFLDNGSMTSIVTTDLKQKLQLIPQPNNSNLFGLGDIPISQNPERCSVQIRSKHDNNIKFDISCLVLPTINRNLPQRYIDVSNINLPRNIKLADPYFNQPAPVDILIGGDIFWSLIGGEQIDIGHDALILRKSKLGWLVGGKTNAFSMSGDKSFNSFLQCNHLSTCSDNLNDSLTKFWQLEQVPQPKEPYTDLEAECEQHFITHTYRDENGRFFVRLPLITEPDCLGNSYRLAKKRFFALEKRFRRSPDLKAAYEQFINEYAELGHLSVSDSDTPDPSFFVPHHAVLKPESESTKIRVVFNGSAPSTSGYSINDLQMVGPTIQDSMFNILLRFRTYKYVLTGDVAKMYRQVMVQECDRDLQLILWRSDENEPLKILKLQTVTYGFSSASFLSTRCLWQLGEECADEKIKTIIQNDFMVDDLLTGSDTEDELHFIKASVERALAAGCFPLRKYRSNLPSILPERDSDGDQGSLVISSSSHTLGVGWDSDADVLHFPTRYSAKDGHPTKRSILSDSLKIHDPLGVLSLLTIIPKVLIQKLWIAQIDWDTPVPRHISEPWQDFVNGLSSLTSLQISRHVLCDSPTHIEMHCFCDSSSIAYAACIYLKSINDKGDIVVRLLCAKAKVAPVQAQSIPRLELCACVLGAQLASAVSKTLRCQIAQKFYWTDSSIVLAWLKTNQTKLKTFVSNRVSHILELTEGSEFRHVPTALNPADFPSRGVEARRLTELDMWWNGPSFLYEPQSNWPKFALNSLCDDLPELKVNVAITNDPRENYFIDFDRYSKLEFLQRALAYLLRFAHNCRHPSNKITGVLKPEELETSFKKLVTLSQQDSFPIELKLLRENQSLSPKSAILSLNPFYDQDDELIRVGGRISSSFYPFDKRHPMLLHSKHRLTRLLFQREHIRLLHAPPQLLLGSIRETVWTVSGRTLARTVSQQCVTCRRVAGRTSAPLMGALPSQRVTPDFPFISVGCDFAGPFMITDRHGRGCKITKCYLAIFVCFRYKCLHLEAVSALSTDAFILSLRRFISRRGRPREIFCDNGRNFLGAAKEISDYLTSNSDEVCNFATNEGIQFKFQPAYAPHFGGLWEAGVKSAKFHLSRILGNAHLTYEELASLFSQVEAILNSRPLCPLSSSPDDFQPLTPGHFLIGRALTSLPSPYLADINPNRLDRFQRLEALRQHFWRRWQVEYVCELQQRTKWRNPGRSLQLGELVLIKDENTAPLHWRLGRIAKLFPGADGISRVAEVATVAGTYKRGVKYLCPLLDETDESLKTDVSKGPQDVPATSTGGEAGAGRV